MTTAVSPLRAALPALLALLAAAAPRLAAQPVAVAGPVQFGECVAGAAKFTLDGAESTGAGPLTYTWTGPFGTVEGPLVEVEAPLGTNEVTLTVEDSGGLTSEDKTTLVVVDTQPPGVGVALNPSLIAPPDGAVKPVTATVFVNDACGQGTTTTLASITSNEPDTTIVVGADFGTFDTEFGLGAILTSDRKRRVYTVTYESRDASNNIGSGSGEVVVDDQGLLDVSPERMLFSYVVGREAPRPQPLSIDSIFPNAFYSIDSGAPWARLSAPNGSIPASLEVSVDPAGLPPGEHWTTLTVDGPADQRRTVYVQLSIADRPAFFALPAALGFRHDVSAPGAGFAAQPAPAGQDVFVGARNSNGAFRVVSSAPWLSVGFDRAATPARFRASVFPEGLGIGSHRGTITLIPEESGLEAIVIPVTLEVVASKGVQAPEFVVHAATMERRPVAPGALVTGFYDNPFVRDTAAPGAPLPRELAGLSATVDGEPVHFSFVGRRQFNAQLPTTLALGVARMEMRFQGRPIGSIPLQVLPASPGIFHAKGQALALNPDGSPNSAARPAPANSAVAIFLSGQGETNAPVATGQPGPRAPFATPVHPVVVAIDGRTVTPPFVGLAPGLVGLTQINVPTAGLSSGAHTVVVTIAGNPSNGVEIHVAGSR